LVVDELLEDISQRSLTVYVVAGSVLDNLSTRGTRNPGVRVNLPGSGL
jgi:hypothetical protein